MARRSPETLADYLVVAIAPALIMLLVGSLMWFLVEVFYQGEFKGRMLWIMAMFVIAIVGIARISIEEGMARASLFGWALAASVAFVLARLVQDGLVLGGLVMVLVWWAAHKLTWDCTVIDEDQDVSGQGLLQQMGMDLGNVAAEVRKASQKENPQANPLPNKEGAVAPHLEAVSGTVSEASPPWWETLWEPDRRPHAPGVWVVYFSLAALPLFGIGGWFVPAADGPRRALVFGLLVIYVACGMGLLLATSFLGLRRYLRQRKLEIPVEMTTTWILVGVVMIIAMLLVAAVLPRPSREYSLSQLPFTVTSAVRRASQYAIGKDGTKDDTAKNPATTEAKQGQETERHGEGKQKGNAGGAQDGGKQGSSGKKGQGQSSDKSGKSQSGGDKNDRGSKSQGDKPPRDKSQAGESQKRNAESQDKQSEAEKSKTEDGGNKGERQDRENQQQKQSSQQNTHERKQNESGSQSPPPSPSKVSQILSQAPSFLTQSFGFILKWLLYGGLIVGGLIAAFIYREELMAAWQKLLAELNELWDWWFGKKKAVAESAAVATEVVAPPRTFASYVDPFLSGDAHGMSWPQLVRYTFEALEAWGRERACPRNTGQTPNEFALALAGTQPQVASGVQMLAAWYGQLAYAPKAAAPASIEPLRQLWAALDQRPTGGQ
ncbi:MAG TPA: DUF4129 domain-containing protein [Pirellulaceae bacterium]|jgi:hypothetical protein